MVIDLYVVAPPGGPEALDPVLEACVEAGLDGLCLLGTAAPPPVQAARASRFAARLGLFFGVQFQVDRGVLVWLPRDPDVLDREDWREPAPRSADDVVALARAHGGTVLATHPYDRSRGTSFGDAIFGVTELGGIQVANARLERFRNNMAIDATIRAKTAAFGGTGPEGPDRIGRAATVFLDALPDQAALVDALLRGDTWAVEFLASPDEDNGREEGRGGRDPDGRPPRRDGGRDRGRGRPAHGHGHRQGGNRR